jgi:hypothetical protein
MAPKGNKTMKRECLTQAAVLAEKGAYLLVATAASDGYPHVAPAGRLTLPAGEEWAAVDAWFCPVTLENLKSGGRIDVVVWDAVLDEGVQLLGICLGVEEIALLNGYDASAPEKAGLPQVERRIRIRVEKALPFRRGAHTDREEC